LHIKDRSGEIRLENINFSYPARPDTEVLRQITVKADRGKTVALVGPSGGGKSTLFALLERFYSPTHGKIVSYNILFSNGLFIWIFPLK